MSLKYVDAYYKAACVIKISAFIKLVEVFTDVQFFGIFDKFYKVFE